MNLPYILAGYFCDKIAWLWRVSPGSNASDKMMAAMNGLNDLFSNPLPSFSQKDLLIGIVGGVALRLVVYFKAKNAKKFRQGVEDAIAVWKSIPPERMNGIPSIGINIHTEGTEHYEDVKMDIFSGKVIDLEVLDYVPDITDDPKAIEVIEELIDKLPDIEVRGSLEKWQAAILASQIDQLSYDYDTYQYQNTVEDREEQVANITEDVRNGNTGYLNDFLNAVISEGAREGITDIFGQGVEVDDSEAVQAARRAKELLDKLAEYKPLAKVEELTEQNYNMIDNVLNNGAEKKEKEQTKGRISIKEKLAEKKAVIEQRDKAERTSPEKETEKKSQREM